MDGMNLFPRGQFIWSVVHVFLLAFFFSPHLDCFFLGAHCFSSWAHFGFFFFLATLTTIFFLGNSYLPLQPTYHPSSYQPIYLPTFTEPAHQPPSFCSPLSCACALHHQRLRFSGFRVAKLQKSEEKQADELGVPRWEELGAPRWEELGASVKNNITTR